MGTAAAAFAGEAWLPGKLNTVAAIIVPYLYSELRTKK
jgi:hypothetical protein